MKHGTKPNTKPNKSYSDDDDNEEREHGVRPSMPARDGTTRTDAVSRKHKEEDQQARTLSPEKGDRLSDL